MLLLAMVEMRKKVALGTREVGQDEVEVTALLSAPLTC